MSWLEESWVRSKTSMSVSEDLLLTSGPTSVGRGASCLDVVLGGSRFFALCRSPKKTSELRPASTTRRGNSRKALCARRFCSRRASVMVLLRRLLSPAACSTCGAAVWLLRRMLELEHLLPPQLPAYQKTRGQSKVVVTWLRVGAGSGQLASGYSPLLCYLGKYHCHPTAVSVEPCSDHLTFAGVYLLTIFDQSEHRAPDMERNTRDDSPLSLHDAPQRCKQVGKHKFQRSQCPRLEQRECLLEFPKRSYQF
jgi:hypothetical protein